MYRIALLLSLIVLPGWAGAEPTRLLRQPTLSASQVAFAYGGDLWVVERAGGDARRLTSTPAVESDPRFSPDGQRIAFTSEAIRKAGGLRRAGGRRHPEAADVVSVRCVRERLDARR